MPATPYLSADDLRASVPDLSSDALYTDAQLEALVAEFESLVERYRGVAYTPREAEDTLIAEAIGVLFLRWPYVGTVTAVTVDGTVATEDDIAGLRVWPEGRVDQGWWAAGAQITITYTHGMEAPPPGVLRACRLFVRREAEAERHPNPGNAYATTNTELGIFTRESTANWAEGRPTGWLDVDRALNQLPDHRVPGIA